MLPRGMLPRTPPEHGKQWTVVRGSVVEVLEPRRRSGWRKYFSSTLPAEVRITIDRYPYSRLKLLLRSMTGGFTVQQTFTVLWRFDRDLPKEGDRVWVTLAYATKMEQHSKGAPPISFKDVETIRNELDAKHREIVDPQNTHFPNN